MDVLAHPRRGGGLELAEEPPRHGGDFVDRALERDLVRAR
jgi:hypothetical protein